MVCYGATQVKGPNAVNCDFDAVEVVAALFTEMAASNPERPDLASQQAAHETD